MDARPVGGWITSMPRSAIREFMTLASARPGTIRLELGEPDFITPEHIIRAAFEAARAGFTKYTPSAGFLSLRELIAERVAKRTDKSVNPQQVIVTTGAVGGISTVLRALLDPGDEILLPDPVWPNYLSIVYLTGARIVQFRRDPGRGFLPDPAEIEAKVTTRTKVLVLNTPCNPTGTVLPRTVLATIGGIAERTGVWVVSDEIYEDLVFEGEHVSVFGLSPPDRTVLISGFSKSYAMTGWRLGWAVCPLSLAPVLGALQEPTTSCASAIAQKAGEAALAGPQECVKIFRDAFRTRRDLVVDILGQFLAAKPSGSFYALVNVKQKTSNSIEFAKDLPRIARGCCRSWCGLRWGHRGPRPSSLHSARCRTARRPPPTPTAHRRMTAGG